MTTAAILLVDDEKLILDCLREELRTRFGSRFQYEAAESAGEAWDVLKDLNESGSRIVVVVSDWLMPEVRGDAFLAEVRHRYPSALRIMLTGQADESAIERSLREAQVYTVLRKPWRAEELARVIEAGLNR